jgi:23S rRNA (adenine2503-C2)-methyltransferase
MNQRILRSIHDVCALEHVRQEFGFNPECIRSFRNAYYKRAEGLEAAKHFLPAEVRDRWDDCFAPAELEVVSRVDSSRDGATKLVFRTRSELLLETVVLRILSGRTSVCVSSQVGCAARCAFCATGQMKMARSLQPSEILAQVQAVSELVRAENRRLRNVVFMGMGEPMHNRSAVTQAIRQLIDPKWFNLSENHILVSTVGIVDELIEFAREMPKINLALSLHAARQEVRELLIPLAKHTPVVELKRSLREIEQCRGRPIMLEYLMLDAVNDGEEDLAALVDFCADLEVHVNLIPFNPIQAPVGVRGAELTLRPSTKARIADFSARLKAKGLRVTTRVSLGGDIAAACGQLVREHDLAHVRKAARSAAERA